MKIFLKICGYVFGFLFFIIGMLFIWASSVGTTMPRIIIGFISLFIGILLILLGKSIVLKEQNSEIKINVELGGDTTLKEFTCKSCGGKLNTNNLKYEQGHIFVSCPFCNNTYEVSEEPKW